MDKRLKQRLIGAAVLVALAVIFLPMLLTGPVERQALDVPIEVPPRPRITATPTAPEPLAEVPVPSRARPVATLEPPLAAESESQPASQSSVVEERAPVPTPVVESEPEPVPVDEALAAWAVQVGSFGSQVNAMGLRDRLREQGYSAYVESASEQSRFYRVRVGPVIDRTEARALQQRLESELDTATLIVSHP